MGVSPRKTCFLMAVYYTNQVARLCTKQARIYWYYWSAVRVGNSWKPKHYACGESNSIDHAPSCKLGGYTSLSHNSITNMAAKIMSELCKDVKIEPYLMPIKNMSFDGKWTSDKDNARLDISAIGVWNSFEKTLMVINHTWIGYLPTCMWKMK